MQIFHLQHRKLNMIDYKTNYPISVKQFIELLNKTTLGARRPLEDEKTRHSNVVPCGFISDRLGW